jgi:hypothetical protein
LGRKVDRPPHGMLYERRFRGVRARPTLRELLNTARDSGYLLDYRFDDDGLLVRRPWLAGPTLDSMFQRIPAEDRLRFSAEAFAKLLRQLDALRTVGLEHGAVHPGNVVVTRGVQLVDVVGNAARLQADAAESRHYPIWMWGPTAPQGRGWGRWDRICLLRMSTLLALGPDAWHGWWNAAEMIDACERWVANARTLFTEDAEAAVRMETSLALARRLVEEGELPELAAGPAPEAVAEAVADASVEEDESSHVLPAVEAGPGEEDSAQVEVMAIEEAPSDIVPIDVEMLDEPDEGVTEPYPVPETAAAARPVVESAYDLPVVTDDPHLPTAEVEVTPPPSGPQEAIREDPLRWFAEHMGTFRTSASETVLRPEQEARAIRAAVNVGLTPERARSALAEWLESSELVRVETLRAQATRTVVDGKHYGKWVRRRAVIMAEWLFTNRGMDAAEATLIVRQIIGEQGLVDERDYRREWVPPLERFLRKNCPRLAYKPRQVRKMVDVVAQHGVPRTLAERWVKSFLAEGGYEVKKGLFG